MVARLQLLGLGQDIGAGWLCGRCMMGGSVFILFLTQL